MYKRARFKLDEAKFFLAYLAREIQPRAGRNEPRASRFFLSAFLSAARRTNYVLEHTDERAYERWPEWREGLKGEDREIVDLMESDRRHEVHRRGSKVTDKKIPIRAEMLPDLQVGGPVGPDLSQYPANFVEVPEWVYGDNHQAVEACRQYLKVLERFFQELDESEKGD